MEKDVVYYRQPHLRSSDLGSSPGLGSGAEVGTIGGIVSVVAMALVGAVTSYISYQKKKLCFRIQREEPPGLKLSLTLSQEA
ncbi:unnamed protein product [Boreogadus saida]